MQSEKISMSIYETVIMAYNILQTNNLNITNKNMKMLPGHMSSMNEIPMLRFFGENAT